MVSTPAVPQILSRPAQSQALAVTTAPTSAPTSSVLDEFFALMSKHEKEMAEVDPLVNQLQQWNLQSPAVTKPKAVLSQSAKTPLGDVSNLPQKPPANIVINQPPQLALGGVGGLPPKPQLKTRSTACLFESPEVHVRLPPSDAQKEMTIESPLKTNGQLLTLPQKKVSARCNCTPKVKPQKGLAASRFASKETEGSPFANKFSVNLQIAIHQEFCPLFAEQNKSNTGQGKDTSNAQRALRADAKPFTPQSCKRLIVDPGF